MSGGSGGSGQMTEQDWVLHDDFLRNEEKERYNQLISTSTPTAPTTVSTTHHGQKQATSLATESGIVVSVGECQFLVRPRAPPAGPE
jgi:hypothetical protein